MAIWETQAKFEEALKTVKKRILIESPWIKRATLQYIPLMEKALKQGVEIFILYGIEGNDEHHRKAEREVERLDRVVNDVNSVSNIYMVTDPNLLIGSSLNKHTINVGELKSPRLITQLDSTEN